MGEKIYNLKERTFKFAQRILDIVEKLPRKPQGEVIRIKLSKAGTSVGANVEEADGTVINNIFFGILKLGFVW